MESLVKAGAFDRFADRNLLLFNLDTLLAYSSRLHKQNNSGQVDLFDDYDTSGENQKRMKIELKLPTTVLDHREQLLWERELLGLYLSSHPLEPFEIMLSEQTVPVSELKPELDGKKVSIGGNITDVREIMTKNGQKMAFVKLEDFSGETEIILFPKSYEKTQAVWQRDHIVIINGKINARDKSGNMTTEAKVMVDEAKEITSADAEAYLAIGKKHKLPTAKAVIPKPLEPMLGPGAKAVNDDKTSVGQRVYIRLLSTDNETVLFDLKQTIDKNRGSTEVILVLGEAEAKQAIKLPYGIDKGKDSLSQLQDLVGPDNLVIR
jgi:DNA polymerase III alpha subunit